jgi:hypothetical protein
MSYFTTAEFTTFMASINEKFVVEGTCEAGLTAELASAIANRCKAAGVRQSLRTYGADYKTVLRLAQPQVKSRDARKANNVALNHYAVL